MIKIYALSLQPRLHQLIASLLTEGRRSIADAQSHGRGHQDVTGSMKSAEVGVHTPDLNHTLHPVRTAGSAGCVAVFRFLSQSLPLSLCVCVCVCVCVCFCTRHTLVVPTREVQKSL